MTSSTAKSERSALALLTVALLAGGSASAAAQSSSSCEQRRSEDHIVDVTFAGGGAPIRELEAATTNLLGDLPVVVCPVRTDQVDPVRIIERPADAPPAFVRIWLTSSERGATVFVVDGDWNRILVRHIDLEDGLDVAAAEELAQIAFSTVDALLAGAVIGVSEPVTEPAVVDAPAPMFERRRPVEVQLRYGGRVAGRGVPFRHELALATSVAGRSDGVVPAFGVAVGYRFPATDETSAVDIHTSGALLRLEAALHIPLNTSTSLRPSAGLGLEAVFVDPRAVAGSDVVPSSSTVALRPLATASVAVQRRVTGRLSVVAAAALDLDILDSRFSIDDAGDRMTVAGSWQLQPGLWIAVASEL